MLLLREAVLTHGLVHGGAFALCASLYVLGILRCCLGLPAQHVGIDTKQRFDIVYVCVCASGDIALLPELLVHHLGMHEDLFPSSVSL